MVDVEAMNRNYSKEEIVWILGDLFLSTGWLIIEIHYLHSVLTAAPLTRVRSIFQFSRSRNSIIIVNKCDIVESRRYRHNSLCLLIGLPSLSWTVVVSVNSVNIRPHRMLDDRKRRNSTSKTASAGLNFLSLYPPAVECDECLEWSYCHSVFGIPGVQ